jgi:hypothetical protein
MEFAKIHPSLHLTPFEGLPDHIDTIYYHDLKSFTIKVSETKGVPPVVPGSYRHKLRATADQSIGVLDATTHLTMPIFMGSNRESNTVMIDTGSTHLTLASSVCTQCVGTKYDYTAELGGSFTAGAA